VASAYCTETFSNAACHVWNFRNISLLIGIIARCDVSAQRVAFKLGGDNAFNIANRRFFKW
jgi:low affinity Fe/Cu permease